MTIECEEFAEKEGDTEKLKTTRNNIGTLNIFIEYSII